MRSGGAAFIGARALNSLANRPFIVTQSDLLTSSTAPLQPRGSPYSSRFAAPHAQRSELEASVNNALLGLTGLGLHIALRRRRRGCFGCNTREAFVECPIERMLLKRLRMPHATRQFED